MGETKQTNKISDKDLSKLMQFSLNRKPSEEEINTLREDNDEISRLLRISMVKASKLNYNPKKKFGKDYKQKRKARNRIVSQSRKNNR